MCSSKSPLNRFYVFENYTLTPLFLCNSFIDSFIYLFIARNTCQGWGGYRVEYINSNRKVGGQASYFPDSQPKYQVRKAHFTSNFSQVIPLPQLDHGYGGRWLNHHVVH